MYVCSHVMSSCPLQVTTVHCTVSTALLFVSSLAVSSGEAVVKCFVGTAAAGEAQGRGKLLG